MPNGTELLRLLLFFTRFPSLEHPSQIRLELPETQLAAFVFLVPRRRQRPVADTENAQSEESQTYQQRGDIGKWKPFAGNDEVAADQTENPQDSGRAAKNCHPLHHPPIDDFGDGSRLWGGCGCGFSRICSFTFWGFVCRFGGGCRLGFGGFYLLRFGRLAIFFRLEGKTIARRFGGHEICLTANA